MTGRFEGKVALVTGGTLGIGKATATALAREGARVVLCGRGREHGEGAVRSIWHQGGEALFVQADVANAREVEALVGHVVESYGRLDCAFNNAGVLGPVGQVCDCTEADWDQVVVLDWGSAMKADQIACA